MAHAKKTGLLIRVHRDDLKTAVARVIPATDRSKYPSTPILANIKLEVLNSVLTINGTNLETIVTRRIQGGSSRDGAVTVKAAVLAKLLPLYDGDIVTLESDMSDDSLFIECGMNTTHIDGIMAAEYPLCPARPGDALATVEAADLLRLIDDVHFCAGKGKRTAEQFFHVDVTITNGRLAMTAMGSNNSLGTGSIKAAHEALETAVSFVIPAAALKKIVAPIAKEAAKSWISTAVTISLFQAGEFWRAWFSTSFSDVSIVTFDGERTAYDHILSDVFNISAVVEKASMMRALKTVTAVNGKGRGKVKDVIISMDGGGVTVGPADNAPSSVLLPVETAVTNDKPAVRGEAVVHSQRVDFVTQMVKRIDGRVKLSVNEDRTLLRINCYGDGAGELDYYLSI